MDYEQKLKAMAHRERERATPKGRAIRSFRCCCLAVAVEPRELTPLIYFCNGRRQKSRLLFPFSSPSYLSLCCLLNVWVSLPFYSNIFGAACTRVVSVCDWTLCVKKTKKKLHAVCPLKSCNLKVGNWAKFSKGQRLILKGSNEIGLVNFWVSLPRQPIIKKKVEEFVQYPTIISINVVSNRRDGTTHTYKLHIYVYNSLIYMV